MFTDDFCDDWDSTEKQDVFIKSYFTKRKVDSVKASSVVESLSKYKNIDIVKNSYSMNNPARYNYGESSGKNYSEIRSQSQNMQVIDPSNSLLDHLKNNKKRKNSKNKNKNVSNKSLKQLNNITDSENEIVNNFSTHSIKAVHVQDNERDSHSLKLKMKKKKIRNKKKYIPEEKPCMPNELSNETETDQLEHNEQKVECEESLYNFSQDINPEIHTQSPNMEVSSNSALGQIKNKRKGKKSKNKDKNILNESLELINNIGDSKTETVTNSIQSDDLHNSEADFNYLNSKTKSKKLKNKVKSVSEEKSFMTDESPNVIQKHNLDEKDSDFNYLKMKNSEKFLESDTAELASSSNSLSAKDNNLHQNKAYQKLQAAKFRYLNEMLYMNSGKDALSYFQQNADDFLDYHDGYQSQVSKWPINPVDIIIQEISQMNKKAVIADLGCGAAKIAEVFPNRTIFSFDLIALKDCVTACDIANVPLSASSVDVVVFCLSLMGTNWKDYLKESCRILKLGGIMKIAEIESRIENLQHFIKEIENFGFSLMNQNLSHKMFVFLNFKRIKRSKKSSSKVPAVILKPCLYKKR